MGEAASVLVRVWLPDRPGALGLVASRIGAVRGDIVGIDVLERGEGVVIDEFAVRLGDVELLSVLIREVEEVDGASVDVDGIRFTVCPWWDGELTRDEVDAQLAAAALDRPERWVWVYHSPPAGTVLCRDGRREFPDHELAAWIERYQPDVVICGHIHQAPWAKGGSWHARLGRTQVFNAGKQIGHVPPHITFDTDARTAHWFGVFESETIRLD